MNFNIGTAPANSFFGASPAAAPALSTTSMFGTSLAGAPAPSLFGATPSSTGASMFGGAAVPAPASRLFGGSPAAAPALSSTPLFGTAVASAQVGVNNQFQPTAGPSFAPQGGFGAAAAAGSFGSKQGFKQSGDNCQSGIVNSICASMRDQSLESQRSVDYLTNRKGPAQTTFGASFGVGSSTGVAPFGQHAFSLTQPNTGLSGQSNTGSGANLQSASSGTPRAIEKKLVALKSVDEALESLRLPIKPEQSRSIADTEKLKQSLQRSQDVLILDVARLRLQEAIDVHERNNPSNPELPTLRSTLKELVDRLNVPALPLP